MFKNKLVNDQTIDFIHSFKMHANRVIRSIISFNNGSMTMKKCNCNSYLSKNHYDFFILPTTPITDNYVDILIFFISSSHFERFLHLISFLKGLIDLMLHWINFIYISCDVSSVKGLSTHQNKQERVSKLKSYMQILFFISF